MSEILGFRATEYLPERPKKSSVFKRNVMRSFTAGLFALSAYMGIKYGADAIWGSHGTQEHQLVSNEQSQQITDGMLQQKAQEVVEETADGVRSFMLATAGFAGVAAISIGIAARRNHYAGETAEDAVEEEYAPMPESAANDYLGYQAVYYTTAHIDAVSAPIYDAYDSYYPPQTSVAEDAGREVISITPAMAYSHTAQAFTPTTSAPEPFDAFRW